MQLYLFNPDADLALADNGLNYLPSALVARMAEDLALLPLWYAPLDGGVLVPSVRSMGVIDGMRSFFSLPVCTVAMSELSCLPHTGIEPWGWNRALRYRLLKAGVSEGQLPDLSWLDTYRRCSSRLTALEILNEMRNFPDCCGEGDFLVTAEACKDYLGRHADCVFKSLWSGSGKGLRWCRGGNFPPDTANWCVRMQREQGGLVAMPIYNKVEDFAMEFRSDGKGGVEFVGYSLFFTNGKGAYAGNLLDTDERLEQRLTTYIPPESLHRVRGYLQTVLAERFARMYNGYIGVDMMICYRYGAEGYELFPCVEINLRMNMGVVAHEFYRRFVQQGKTGVFRVEYHRSTGDLLAEHRERTAIAPAVVRGGCLSSGYMSLVPVTPESRYRVYVEVRDVDDTMCGIHGRDVRNGDF